MYYRQKQTEFYTSSVQSLIKTLVFKGKDTKI